MRTPRIPFPVRLPQWAGWVAVAAGAVLCVLGWYGVSGERFAERQLPYLASCTVPGAALIVAGAVLIAREEDRLAADRVAEVHRLLVASAGAPEEGAAGRRPEDQEGRGASSRPSGPLLAVPGGTLAHRPDCPMVAARPDAFPARTGASGQPALAPCPLCDPPWDDGAGTQADAEAEQERDRRPEKAPDDDTGPGPQEGPTSGPGEGR